ncbi:metallophosphoesterase family protein [Blastococcus goldschmidtiae]|uniref:Metallophosphoesterase n=1 Tax=Blastococcus goldschmidtiae TaxID=3075546 RepID=A0ABU2KB30_9ACTN|nr:metallophosphoesterase [Blastococcus sp. DSM 46792]MDT0277373.1 metallophosphoesterase [Blastococcus sp. DSM 46792]
MRETWMRITASIAALLAIVAFAALRPWESDEPQDEPGTVTVLAVGDIARCGSDADEQTAELVQRYPSAAVLAPGDLAYNSGTAEEFAECYDPVWGQFNSRLYPVPGNHDYGTDDAAPYFDYFGQRAGEPGKGWYSFDLGAWHVVALNSNCFAVACDEGSEQEQWLRADLEADDSRCTLAFWHAPRFSSGRHDGTRSVEDLWQVLLDHDVELLLSGHEHLYERTAPLDADGAVDESAGVRQFVVGTGGGNFYEIEERMPGSEAAITDALGVLRLSLGEDSYEWDFLPVTEDGTDDRGSDQCR